MWTLEGSHWVKKNIQSNQLAFYAKRLVELGYEGYSDVSMTEASKTYLRRFGIKKFK